jgi:hypothetical protein
VDVLSELGNGGDYEGGAVVDAGVAAILDGIEVAAGSAGTGSRPATGMGLGPFGGGLQPVDLG